MEDDRVPAGRWVRLHRLELAPSERAPGIPEDTASVPFESWINGWLVQESRLGDTAQVRTPAGRTVEGELVEVAPGYTHSFGAPPEALHRAGQQARALLFPEVGR